MFHYDLIGTKSGPFVHRYTWKDLILYALGVGAGEDEPYYLYEKCLKALPTYGAILQPMAPIGLPKRLVGDLKGMLHMENELIQYRPLDPHGGELYYETVLEALYDKGEGKGGKMVVRTDIYNAFGDLMCVNHDSLFSRADGGWGGEQPPKNHNDMPDRPPDIEVPVLTSRTQPYLYRLTGDFFPLHVDQEFAQASGFERPIMHGLCTYGIACRVAIEHLFPGEPERLRRVNACFMRSLYPGDPIQVQIWKLSEGEARFQVKDQRTGEIPIGKGVLEWD